MATLEENIETLSQRMLNDANVEAEKILAEARAKANEIKKRGQAQADAECKAIFERAQQERERMRGQAVATTELKARNDQLEFREQLLDEVFKATGDKISTIQQWNNYDEIAIMLLKDALMHLKNYPVQVKVDPVIWKLIPEARLVQIAKDLNVEVTGFSELSQGTGVIVETADGHLNYDNTLETRLARLQNSLRAPVFHILMGEQV
jgi:vacuolar-type H+-ATPase subunit E/Vma4